MKGVLSRRKSDYISFLMVEVTGFLKLVGYKVCNLFIESGTSNIIFAGLDY